MSSLADLLSKDDGGILENYWIAGDAAYVCTNRLLCPWPGRNITVAKDCFNYWQSSARIHIEQAFGIMVARWGILWRPLRVSVSKAAKIVVTCAKLHNFIIDNSNSSSLSQELPPSSNNCDSPIDQMIHFQDTCDTEMEIHNRSRDLETSDIRAALTDRLRIEGLTRPLLY